MLHGRDRTDCRLIVILSKLPHPRQRMWVGAIARRLHHHIADLELCGKDVWCLAQNGTEIRFPRWDCRGLFPEYLPKQLPRSLN